MAALALLPLLLPFALVPWVLLPTTRSVALRLAPWAPLPALFLGAGLTRTHGANALHRAALAVPALALAGSPLTSGVLAKDGLKQALATLPGPWADLVAGLLPFAAQGAALLMARLIWLAWHLPAPADVAATPHGLLAPWLLAVFASALLPWGLASSEARSQAFQVATLAAAALRLHLRTPALQRGDLLNPLVHGIERLRGARPRWRFPETSDWAPRMQGGAAQDTRGHGQPPDRHAVARPARGVRPPAGPLRGRRNCSGRNRVTHLKVAIDSCQNGTALQVTCQHGLQQNQY